MVDLHTSSQPKEDPANISGAIQGAINTLRAIFPKQEIDAHRWNSNYIAVPVEVTVNLPARGPVGDIDIRAAEPVFLLFHRAEYPYRAPFAYSNRKGFPKAALPHLNPTRKGVPASFCLHRGSLDTWFAEHTLEDLVQRVRFWLRDAARNRLIPHGDAFEPTHFIDQFGQLIFEPDLFREIISSANIASTNGGSRLIAYELLDQDAKAAVAVDGYAARAVAVPSDEDAIKHLQVAELLNELASKEEYKKLFKKRLFGLLVWAPPASISSSYFGELPSSLEELFSWGDDLSLPIREAMTSYLSGGYQLLGGVPVTVAIRRPKPLIGSSSNLELLTFLVLATGDHWPKDGNWDLAAEVNVADHRTPLTQSFARSLSSHPEDYQMAPLILLGCGSLGSRIATHLARSGQTAMTLVDHAKLSPHHMVRHTLGGRYIGRAKAEALRDELKEFFPEDTLDQLTAIEGSAFDLVKGDKVPQLQAHRYLLDATASSQVLNLLIEEPLPPGLKVVRAEIGHHGRLGIMSIEGDQRNPRLDDLQASLFHTAFEDTAVARWLISVETSRSGSVGSGLEDVQIGLSCSSATMRLSDENVALHGAVMSLRARDVVWGATAKSNSAGLFLTVLEENGSVRTIQKSVPPVHICAARNDPQWQVRFSASVVQHMQTALRRAKPSETGGLLIGMVHNKRRIVYVTGLLDAPRDSEGSPVAFKRGIQDLPEAIKNIEKCTGGLLGYVGEWHTHPAGGPDMSIVDIVAAARLKGVLDTVPLPTHITIVTPRGIYPHVFEPNTGQMLIRKASLYMVEVAHAARL